MKDLQLRPIGLRAANAFVDAVHRHHDSVTGHKFSVSVVDAAGDVHGVGIAGRPVSRTLDADGWIEIVRVASDGTPDVCSMLYGSLRRAALSLGYDKTKIVTYTLQSEDGASLRAAGFVEEKDFASKGGTWLRENRPRNDHHPLEPKRRWRAALPIAGAA